MSEEGRGALGEAEEVCSFRSVELVRALYSTLLQLSARREVQREPSNDLGAGERRLQKKKLYAGLEKRERRRRGEGDRAPRTCSRRRAGARRPAAARVTRSGERRASRATLELLARAAAGSPRRGRERGRGAPRRAPGARSMSCAAPHRSSSCAYSCTRAVRPRARSPPALLLLLPRPPRALLRRAPNPLAPQLDLVLAPEREDVPHALGVGLVEAVRFLGAGAGGGGGVPRLEVGRRLEGGDFFVELRVELFKAGVAAGGRAGGREGMGRGGEKVRSGSGSSGRETQTRRESEERTDCRARCERARGGAPCAPRRTPWCRRGGR